MLKTQSKEDSKCLGSFNTAGGSETELPCVLAKQDYGIVIRHGKMSTNGELRFRLESKFDGSAYIRTQTTPQSKGWQNSHFHKKLIETYIVEKGWIGYVERTGDSPNFYKYVEGEVFSTSPGIVHNIYMPENSVIHTVKHGGPPVSPGSKDDWEPDNEFTNYLKANFFENTFSTATPKQNIGTSDLEEPMSLSTENKFQGFNDHEYSESYRHFDTLIWQIPTLSTAIFTGLLIGYSALNSASTLIAKQLEDVGLVVGSQTMFGLVTLLFGLIMLVMAYTLVRFRSHQVKLKNWSSTSLSPQKLLQFVINFQTFLILFVGFIFLGIDYKFSLGSILALFAAWCLFFEHKINEITSNKILHERS